MSGRIPENIVDRIKIETDLVSVISEFVSLKKSGGSYKGLCPFHQEKTPSFFVVPSKGFYHCFGCGKGGNAINFIMEFERLDYPSALRYLAEKAGITIPVDNSASSYEEGLYGALSSASSFYESCLNDSSSGKSALKYLHSREITKDTAKLFGFGYAPDGWDNLIKALTAKGVKMGDLESAGLIIKKEGYYDRFRKRLMVPVRTLSGKVVGFGGRVLPGDDSPKYINSPETAVYKKGRILFGMDVSKNEIRSKNEAVVVEGYFDLISLYQAGIKNVVAVSGTGFTSEQASLLARFCQRVVLLFDADSAGVKAAVRACGILYNAGLDPYLVRLPSGFDPDSFVKQKGQEELSRIISQAADIIDFIRAGIKGRFSDQSLPRQKKIVRALSELMAPVEDKLTRDLLAKKMFDVLEIDMKTIGIIGEAKDTDTRIEQATLISGRDKFEREFLAMLMARQEFVHRCTESIDASLFTDTINADLYSIIIKSHSEKGDMDVSRILDELGEGFAGRRFREIAVKSERTTFLDQEFDDYFAKFKSISLKKRLDEIKSLIGEAEKNSDINRLESLTREFQNLKLEVKAHDARV